MAKKNYENHQRVPLKAIKIEKNSINKGQVFRDPSPPKLGAKLIFPKDGEEAQPQQDYLGEVSVRKVESGLLVKHGKTKDSPNASQF